MSTVTGDVAQRLERIDWDFVDHNPSVRAAEIHRTHWYPAPFVPALAGVLAEVLSEQGDTVLDPFSGSGVAPIESWVLGRRAIGIDVNRSAIDISIAKVELLAAAETRDGLDLADEYLAFRSDNGGNWQKLSVEEACKAASIESDAMRWFDGQVLRELAIVKHWLSEGFTDERWVRVARIAVSSILHKKLSELREVHYTYIVDRSKTKHTPEDQPDVASVVVKRLGEVFRQAHVARTRIERAGIELAAVAVPQFLHANASESARLLDRDVDLIITSPPYFGMNDYVRSQYLTWLIFPWEGFDSDRLLEIGSRRDRRSVQQLERYLAGVRETFKMAFDCLAEDGHLAIVLGASRSPISSQRRPMVDVSTALTDAGFKFVWQGDRQVRFRKINNAPEAREAIWVLRK